LHPYVWDFLGGARYRGRYINMAKSTLSILRNVIEEKLFYFPKNIVCTQLKKSKYSKRVWIIAVFHPQRTKFSRKPSTKIFEQFIKKIFLTSWSSYPSADHTKMHSFVYSRKKVQKYAIYSVKKKVPSEWAAKVKIQALFKQVRKNKRNRCRIF